MNPSDVLPWVVLVGLAVLALFTLGPFVTGLLLLLVFLLTVANLICPR